MFIEHIPKETPKKMRETAFAAPKRAKEVVGNGALGETSFEVFPEAREGDRQKRRALVFDTTRDRFIITRGASVTDTG
jgi:hypothetical protein